MDVIDAYDRLRSGNDAWLPEMRRGAYILQHARLRTAEAAWHALREISPRQGWLQCQSHQAVFADGWPEADRAWGSLIAAEAVDGQGRSCALALDGAAGWLLTTCIHTDAGDHLVDEVCHLAHDVAFGALRYRRYWRRSAQRGYVQAFACFIGLTQGE